MLYEHPAGDGSAAFVDRELPPAPGGWQHSGNTARKYGSKIQLENTAGKTAKNDSKRLSKLAFRKETDCQFVPVTPIMG
jgi:hypothetical protein